MNLNSFQKGSTPKPQPQNTATPPLRFLEESTGKLFPNALPSLRHIFLFTLGNPSISMATMYEHFFGFSESPFSVTPDPAFLFLSPTHQEALAHLRYGIEERKGFIALTGEVGSGKTLLSRTLLNQLDPNIFDTILIFNPQMDEVQLLRAILRDLGEQVDLVAVDDLVHRIYESILRRVRSGKCVVLVIDEAQNLPVQVFEQVRLLSNLEADNQKLLQIVLIGQPELKAKLNQSSLRQLKQRILVHYDITPLNKEDVRAYVKHRVQLASRETTPPEFTYWACSKIYRYSKGIPRVINNICDKALLAAFVRSSKCVKRTDVQRAIHDIKRLDNQ